MDKTDPTQGKISRIITVKILDYDTRTKIDKAILKYEGWILDPEYKNDYYFCRVDKEGNKETLIDSGGLSFNEYDIVGTILNRLMVREVIDWWTYDGRGLCISQNTVARRICANTGTGSEYNDVFRIALVQLLDLKGDWEI